MNMVTSDTLILIEFLVTSTNRTVLNVSVQGQIEHLKLCSASTWRMTANRYHQQHLTDLIGFIASVYIVAVGPLRALTGCVGL